MASSIPDLLSLVVTSYSCLTFDKKRIYLWYIPTEVAMKVLSLKLRDDIFSEVERVVHKIHIPRNAYINQALSLYTKLYNRKLLKKKLEKESKAVQGSSLEVLKVFEKLEDELV